MKFSLVVAVVMLALAHGDQENPDIQSIRQQFQSLINTVRDQTLNVDNLHSSAQDLQSKMEPLASDIQEKIQAIALQIQSQMEPLTSNMQTQVTAVVEQFQTQVMDILKKVTQQTEATAN